jgi:hypothetical protein
MCESQSRFPDQFADGTAGHRAGTLWFDFPVLFQNLPGRNLILTLRGPTRYWKTLYLQSIAQIYCKYAPAIRLQFAGAA